MQNKIRETAWLIYREIRHPPNAWALKERFVSREHTMLMSIHSKVRRRPGNNNEADTAEFESTQLWEICPEECLSQN